MSSVRERLARHRRKSPVSLPGKIGFEDVVRRLVDHEQPVDQELLRKIFDFSADKHGDQKRRSGEPYLTHPVQVAYALADLGFDATCVTAAWIEIPRSCSSGNQSMAAVPSSTSPITMRSVISNMSLSGEAPVRARISVT